MPTVINGTTGITTDGINATSGNTSLTTLNVASNPISAVNSLGFRNRIINGDMRIDQRNNGASVTAGSGNVYSLDRWKMLYSVDNRFTVQQQQNPTGIAFSATAQITSSSAYSVGAGDIFAFQQAVEGFNVADLKWGTAAATTVTLGFWVNTSLTGTFGGSVMNSATNRSYPFTYAVSAANTWEFKTVIIPGDTTGTWLTNNGVGLWLSFGLGGGSTFSGTAGAWTGSARYTATGAVSVVGTNGATFFITGVQLEAGTVASPFERRDIGRELMMCQRYYEKSYSQPVTPGASTPEGMVLMPTVDQASSQYAGVTQPFRAEKRASPTMAVWDVVGNLARTTLYSAGGLAQQNNNNNITNILGVTSSFYMILVTAGANFAAFQWTASSEL